jgi:L-aspartate oxidase
LEALVFANRAYLHVVNLISDDTKDLSNQNAFLKNIPDWETAGTNKPKEMILITQSLKELKLLMSDYVGIVRNNERLHRAMRRLDLLFDEIEILYQKTIVSPQLCELRNMITVAYLIVKCAEFRKESRGLHYNTDYLSKDVLIQNIVM